MRMLRPNRAHIRWGGRDRLVAAALLLCATAAQSEPRNATRIEAGTYRTLLPLVTTEREVPVAAFLLDKTPVTNADFLAFVRRHPAWQRSRISRLRADAEYLSHWRGDTALGNAVPKAPVTFVSWFAARAYCIEKGGRLPTEREWERAAQIDDSAPDAPAQRAAVQRWMHSTAPFRLGPVGNGRPNAFGVYDLNLLVWEWVEDFGATLIAVDDREKGDASRDRFCGAGAAQATDPTDYAAFMRMATRSSLTAQATTSSLGFRCAYDVTKKAKQK